jgi:hypothetical protein
VKGGAVEQSISVALALIGGWAFLGFGLRNLERNRIEFALGCIMTWPQVPWLRPSRSRTTS